MASSFIDSQQQFTVSAQALVDKQTVCCPEESGITVGVGGGTSLLDPRVICQPMLAQASCPPGTVECVFNLFGGSVESGICDDQRGRSRASAAAGAGRSGAPGAAGFSAGPPAQEPALAAFGGSGSASAGAEANENEIVPPLDPLLSSVYSVG